MTSITAAIKTGRSNVSMQPFGNRYIVSVYSDRAGTWLQTGSMQFHIARANAARNVVAQSLMALGVDETTADEEAFSTDGAGTTSGYRVGAWSTIRNRVIMGANRLKVHP